TLWGVGALVHDPQAVLQLHRDYVAAGCEVLTANTFRVSPYALRRFPRYPQAWELAQTAVTLARQAAAEAPRRVRVLASMTTLEDCYRPDLAPDDLTLREAHRHTAHILAQASPDGLLLETFNSIREARIACDAARATGLPVLICFACQSGGRLLSGERAAEAAKAVTLPGVVAIGVNCTRLVDLVPALTQMAAVSPLPLVAYANNGWYDEASPHLAAAKVPPEDYARCMLGCLAAGARLVGGCCGTSPEDMAALRALLDQHFPEATMAP
ncbi:MAG: homocysteine S-methyltransferase family protein, partial [Thermoanaerobaculum sp.]|nr:homocysteine S-methyltransferase family protein [Thermoanaerobaculum sp.]